VLREKVRDAQAKFAERTAALDEELSKLQEETAFLEKEGELEAQGFSSRQVKLTKEWGKKYDERHEAGQVSLSRLREDYAIAYEEDMAKTSARAQLWDAESNQEAKGRDQRHCLRMAAVETSWSQRYDRSGNSLANQLHAVCHYSEVITAELHNYRSRGRGCRTVYDEIMKLLKAESVQGSDMFVRAVKDLRLGAPHRLSSSLPRTYGKREALEDGSFIAPPVVGVPPEPNVPLLPINTVAFERALGNILATAQKMSLAHSVSMTPRSPSRASTPSKRSARGVSPLRVSAFQRLIHRDASQRTPSPSILRGGRSPHRAMGSRVGSVMSSSRAVSPSPGTPFRK